MRKNAPPLPSNHDRRQRGKTRPHAFHKRRPAGSKMVVRFFKAKHGVKPETLADAWMWYRLYLADVDKAARKREAERKAARIGRRSECTSRGG